MNSSAYGFQAEARTYKAGKNLVITADRSIFCVDFRPAANREETMFGFFWPQSDAEIQRHLDFHQGVNVIDERVAVSL